MINGTDTEKKKLIEAFFQSLKEEWAAGRSAPAEAATGSLTRQEQMRDLLAVKVDELNGKSHKAQRGNWGVAAGKLFTTVLSFIVTAKDLISTVGGGDPHVALACAGASVILSVSLWLSLGPGSLCDWLWLTRRSSSHNTPSSTRPC
jgi:predicted phage tail protein